MIERQVEIPKKSTTTSPKYPGLAPLILSLKCNQFVATRLLFQNGADIHTPDCEGRTRWNSVCPPLSRLYLSKSSCKFKKLFRGLFYITQNMILIFMGV